MLICLEEETHTDVVLNALKFFAVSTSPKSERPFDVKSAAAAFISALANLADEKNFELGEIMIEAWAQHNATDERPHQFVGAAIAMGMAQLNNDQSALV